MAIDKDVIEAGLALLGGRWQPAARVAAYKLAGIQARKMVNGQNGAPPMVEFDPSSPNAGYQIKQLARENTRRYWADIVGRKFGVYVILGRKRLGKTSLSFRIATDAERDTYCIGIKQKVLPSWVQEIEPDDACGVPNGSAIIVDDASMSYSSASYREDSAEKMVELVNVLSGQKGLLVIINSQLSSLLNRKIVSPDVLLVKPASMLNADNERETMARYFQRAMDEGFNFIDPADWPQYVYAFTDAYRCFMWYERPPDFTEALSFNKV